MLNREQKKKKIQDQKDAAAAALHAAAPVASSTVIKSVAPAVGAGVSAKPRMGLSLSQDAATKRPLMSGMIPKKKMT